ncbi:MAG TPA: hypothetical protein DF383_00570 [Deltaproteobacteria bacterium]|nr:hypothetical protein [Deltaproteobacteria bacterium]
MRSARKRQILNLVGISLSALFLYFCFRSLDAESLKKAFLLPRPWWLLGVLALNFSLMAVRSLTWSALLQALARLPFAELFDILHIGYMANNLLPLKAGEFLRASIVAKRKKLPYAQVLTTVGLERFFPGFTLILLLVVVAGFLEVPFWIKTGAYTTGAVLLGVFGMLVLLWNRRPNLEKWKKRHPFFYRIIEFFYHISEASQPLRSPSAFVNLTFLALLGWALQAGMLFCIEAAYQVQIGFFGTLFVLIAINFAVALPSAPSSLGTFEFAAVLAYTYLGLDKATALGIGFYFHFLQAIPITLIGLFYYFRLGIKLKDLEEAEERKVEALP